MIKIRVVAVGKDKAAWVTDGSAHFEKLLSKYCKISWETIASEKSSSLSSTEIRKREAKRLLSKLGDGFVVALDDSGKAYDSPQLASQLEKWQIQCRGTITFVIGGPYGLDQTVLKRADSRLSLSPLTFSHQIVRLVLLEQLFRAFSILKGTDYHK